MKKLLSVILTVLVLCGLSPLCFASAALDLSQTAKQNPTTITQTIGNGITVKTTISIDQAPVSTFSLLDSYSRSAQITKDVYDGSTHVASITLYASFGYDGGSAWTTSVSSSHSVISGWSYENQSLGRAGNTASLSASLVKWLLFIPEKTVPINMSLSCSAYGDISYSV